MIAIDIYTNQLTRMGKHSSTLLVLIVLLVAERIKAQYANPAAESAIANNSNAHEPLEKSTDRFASICPCIIADKCSSPYDKAADSPDAVPACTEYGTVRCCSGPLKTAESESIEDEDIADNISYDSLNPKELTQEDHISSSNEEMEDLDVEKEFLAIQPKPEDDENPSGGPETAIETPKELLTDENETDETLQAPAIQPGSPVPEMQKFRYAIPDTIYSQVDPFLLEPVLEQVNHICHRLVNNFRKSHYSVCLNEGSRRRTKSVRWKFCKLLLRAAKWTTG